jgi:hypothetical protein
MTLLYKSAIILALFFALVSCRKSPVNYVKSPLELEGDSIIRINQAVKLVDREWITDSMYYVYSRPGRLYRWKSTPDNECVRFSGNQISGLTVVSFKCPGNYVLSADIFNESGTEQTGTTESVSITVTSKVLTPDVPVDREDTLQIAAMQMVYMGQLYPGDLPGTVITVMIRFSTSKFYELPNSTHLPFDFGEETDINHFRFADSLNVFTYPFASTHDQKGPITTYAYFNRVRTGVTEPITVTWLGKRYAGTLSWNAGTSPQIKFEQDGAIILR